MEMPEAVIIEAPQRSEENKQVPPASMIPKRPADEFEDLTTIAPIRTENAVEDGSVQILTLEEGKGAFVADSDVV